MKTIRLLVVADNAQTIESARMAAHDHSDAPADRKRLVSVHRCRGVTRMLPMEDERVGLMPLKMCRCPVCHFKLLVRGY